MGVKTRTGSQDGFKRAVLCTLCVSVGGDIRLNRLQNIVFHFYRNTWLGIDWILLGDNLEIT